VEEYAYDAWGRRRDVTTWLPFKGTAATARGFTGHDTIDLFELVNINGRIYDPRLGRFLSSDNYVQGPDNSQSYNRYTYCLNNPLKYTDPSGYTWFSSFGNWVADNWKPIVTTVVAVAVGVVVTVATAGIGSPVVIAMISAAAAGLAGGVTDTALNGGSFSQCLGTGIQGAVIGGFAGFSGGAVGVGAGWALNAAAEISGGIIGGAVAGATGAFAGGFVGSTMMGQSFNESLKMGLYGAIAGGVIGGIAGGYEAYKSEHARVADGNLDVMGNEMNDEQLNILREILCY
jgi:RHS repeat-associated protein